MTRERHPERVDALIGTWQGTRHDRHPGICGAEEGSVIVGAGRTDDKRSTLDTPVIGEDRGDGPCSQVDPAQSQHDIVALTIAGVERDRPVRVVVSPPVQPRHIRWEIRGQERPVDGGAVSGSVVPNHITSVSGRRARTGSSTDRAAQDAQRPVF